MYPLEAIYGPRSYFEYCDGVSKGKGLTGKSLKCTRQDSNEINEGESLRAESYLELLEKVSFLTVMNKRQTLYFRGQTKPHIAFGNRFPSIRPAIFRERWASLSGRLHNIRASGSVREQIFNYLNNEISEIIFEACGKFPMPRRRTLEMFREAVWSVAQHYELWPTPLIDVTPNLRIAASFALYGGQSAGCLYVTALPASTNSITHDADQHIVLARLQAVCPPVAKRPHYQDGFLAGRFPFVSPAPNSVDRDPAKASDLSRRLVARIDLFDADDEPSRLLRRPSGRGFWNDDFLRMSEQSLMPSRDNDDLLASFMQYAEQIDDAMERICKGAIA